ncbi:GMC oxidoreductase-domain-containing protein [Aspergillus cavernicola]|uniref:GMC oxidoreductase-domain-containing protein n=1 Tax=Aspergillus cavernicola TaxID=176166 RepID=A0ABR4IE82_9EURO
MTFSKSALLSFLYLTCPTLGLFNLGVPGISWSYDYVVVGGGTSDLAIAARLAENSKVTVAVVEGGGHYEIEGGMMSVIPGPAAANAGTDPSDDSMLGTATLCRSRLQTIESFAILGANAWAALLSLMVCHRAFQSPQLPMVSGVGPKATLQNLGIKVVKDLPEVGQNLWDYALFSIVNGVNFATASRLVNDMLAAAEALVHLRKNFTNSTRKALNTFSSDWPEVEYIGLDGILEAGTAPTTKTSEMATTTAPSLPRFYLTHPADQDVAVAAAQCARQAFDSTGIIIGDKTPPGPDVKTDKEILDCIRSTIVRVWHTAGTCAMGEPSNPNAVVGAHAKVIGIKNLRVVDASIFPMLPPGHTQSTCYIVVEKNCGCNQKWELDLTHLRPFLVTSRTTR